MSPPGGDSAAAAYRKRQTPSAPSYSPNETLNQMTQEAEARQQDKLTAQKEMRAIRAAEIERKRNEDEEKERRGRFDSTPPTSTSLTKSRQTSVSTRLDALSDEINLNDPKELQKKIKEMDEKFKKHAMYQTQIENDNQKLIYEVELLKDIIEENDELIVELKRQFKDKSRELDFEKRSKKDLQTDFNRLKEILKQRDALIENSGLILYTDNEVKKKANSITAAAMSSTTSTTLLKEDTIKATSTSLNNTNSLNSSTANNSSLDEIRSVLPAALVSPATAKLLDTLGEGTIDDKLKQLLSDKQELQETTNRLMSEIEKERNRSTNLERRMLENASKLLDNQDLSQDLHEMQRQYTKEINDLKMKLQKLEHENIIIKQDKQRLDTQLKYLQTNFEELEQTERKLMKEKREAQRELNESKMIISDLTLKLEVYQKTLEKKRQQTPKYIDSSNYTSLTTSSLITTPPTATTQLNHHHLTSMSSSSSLSSISSTTNTTPTNTSTTTTTATSTSTITPTSTNGTMEKSSQEVLDRKSSISSLLEIKQNSSLPNLEDLNGNKSTSTNEKLISECSTASPTLSSNSSSNSSSSSASPTSSDRHVTSTNGNGNHNNLDEESTTTTTPIKSLNSNKDLLIDAANMESSGGNSSKTSREQPL